MNLTRYTLSMMLSLSLGLMGQAHERDKAKPAQPPIDPAERVEKLLQTLKTERKETLRVNAAEELGKFTSSEYPEIVSGLIDALVRDESTSVRKTVIHTLADIEPATHEVKDALDQAVKQDKAWTVRQAARIALWRYKPKDEPPSVPGPKLRNTSKPSSTGKVPPAKADKVKPEEPVDPFKSLPIPSAPAPVVPVAPALPPAEKTPAPARKRNSDSGSFSPLPSRESGRG